MEEIECPLCGYTAEEDDFEWETGYHARCPSCEQWFDLEEE